MGTTITDRRTLKNSAANFAPVVQAARPAPDPLFVRLQEATRIFGLSRSDLYRRAARGEIVFRKAGGRVLVEYAALKAIVEGLPRAVIKVAA